MEKGNVSISRWCLFTRSVQDFPDVCLVGSKVFSCNNSGSSVEGEDEEREIQDNTYEYYSWYKISRCIGGEPIASVYRRLRMSSSADGYPADCIVFDSLTAEQLGLRATDRTTIDKTALYKRYTHFRNTKIVSSTQRRRPDCSDSPSEFERGEGVEAEFRVLGFPINECADGESIVLAKAGNRPSSIWGRTIRHPDYALSFSSKIALISLIVATVSLAVSVVSCCSSFA